jgi:uncharacterized protein (DUF1800 family)
LDTLLNGCAATTPPNSLCANGGKGLRERSSAAWAPFEPSGTDPWDLRKVAHLHRRAGFGATWDELHRDLEQGPAASVDRLLDPPDSSADEPEILDTLRKGAVGSGNLQRLKAYWLYRMRFGADPLREKLTLFWHGHFATSIKKVESLWALEQQVETLREHALGSLGSLLTAIVSDPAMLIWLDGGTSKKERPNENFAREFLELFTLGPGHYTEADIREAARAFTGWVPELSQSAAAEPHPRFRYDPAHHDDGPKTFLGQAGAWKAPDIVRITLERPEAAEFLARKLYRFLINESDVPGPELVAPLAQELRSSGYSMKHVLGVILRSRHFFSRAAFGRRVKSPVESSLGLVRVLEVPRSDLNLLALAAACDRQGQALFAPPSVEGWQGGTHWINSTTLLERLNWASDVVWGNADQGVQAYDPLAWARARSVAPAKTAAALVELLIQSGLDPEAKALILAAGSDGAPDGLRKALQRLLHCPEFQLA